MTFSGALLLAPVALLAQDNSSAPAPTQAPRLAGKIRGHPATQACRAAG